VKRKQTEEAALEALRGLEADGPTVDSLSALGTLLTSDWQRVVAGCARLAREWGATGQAPALAHAFSRLLGSPKSDPGCLAKAAALEALNALDYDDAAPFAAGVDYQQMEPVWGGSVDTAGNVRGLSLQGLVRLAHPDDLMLCVSLLHDPQAETRRHAIAAVAQRGGDCAEAVLRMKALGGDASPEVLSDLYGALMALAPDRSGPFLACLLVSEEAVVSEAAALALGESRMDAGWTALVKHWEASVREEERERLLLPMGLHRSDASRAFLLAVVEEAGGRLPAAAVRALAIRRDDDSLREEVEQALARRDDRALVEVYKEAFVRAQD
jgi:hypothetical protein